MLPMRQLTQVQLVVERAPREGSLVWHPDAYGVGLGWPVLALQMVLNAFGGPECVEVRGVASRIESLFCFFVRARVSLSACG